VLSRSRTMATRMIGGFDERDTCLETETIRMSLCNARAMWAAAGSYNCGGIPGTCSILHRPSLPTSREDQVARRIPAKRGTIAMSKHWVPRASGRLAQARLRQ
jgi:hypothetical protein